MLRQVGGSRDASRSSAINSGFSEAPVAIWSSHDGEPPAGSARPALDHAGRAGTGSSRQVDLALFCEARLDPAVMRVTSEPLITADACQAGGASEAARAPDVQGARISSTRGR